MKVLVLAIVLFMATLAFAAEPAPQAPTPAPQPQQQINLSRRDELMINRGMNMNAAKPYLEAIERIDAELTKLDAEAKAPPTKGAKQ